MAAMTQLSPNRLPTTVEAGVRVAVKPEISLVTATFNRAGPLDKLLNILKDQTLAKGRWEIIVAVDGSRDHTEQILKKWSSENSLPLTWFYQENSGQCVARHHAILKSESNNIVIIDDDLNPCPAFIESHLKALEDDDGKTVVIGKVVPPKNLEKRPIYELEREYRTTCIHDHFEKGIVKPTGEDFVTQNVSFHKKFYLDVGGFDPEMRLGEDTLLGIRFERAGGNFIFCKEAWAIHDSNIGSYKTWIKRQYDYGKYIWIAWKKTNEDIYFHPLRDFCTGNRLNRWAVLLFVRSDVLTNLMVSFFRWFGIFLKKMNLMEPAIATHKAIISLKQHQGLRDVYGSWAAFRKAEREYNQK
jgi:glycosyltransferase involved in cell wall biosynthesis